MRVSTIALLLIVCACTLNQSRTSATVITTTDIVPTTTTESGVAGPRSLRTTLVVEDGVSEEFAFTVPDGTRSIGVTALGAPDDVIGVAGLVLADGTDRVGIARIPPPLLESIADQHLRLLPGDVFQEAGVGVHGFVYPNAPGAGEALPAGDATLRLVSTGRNLDVTVSLPPVADERALPLDVFVLDPDVTLTGDSPALTTAEDVLSQAGIAVEWVTVTALDIAVPAAGIDRYVDVGGPLAELMAASAEAGTDALDIFVVASLPVSGLTPRIPGPMVPSPLGAVVIKTSPRPSDMGRVIAHEVAHYLGLHHLEVFTDDNRTIPDPIPDTSPGGNNLMSGGTILTEGQIEVIRRSPVLEPTD